ncbi:PREDICTED: uncharacterized protein LOC101310918 [Fragaria vesca subsp. vesca]
MDPKSSPPNSNTTVPVTQALWEARSHMFERLLDPPVDAPPQSELLNRTPSQSRTTISLHCYAVDTTTRPLLLVTASVDKIVLKKPISVDIDLEIVGAVIWVGRSSIEIQLEVTQSTKGTLNSVVPLVLRD